MAITARTATSTTAASGASLTFTLPTGTVVGDILVAGIATAATTGPAAPTGWTQILTTSPGTSASVTSYWAPFSAGLTLVFASMPGTAAGVINAYTGADLRNAIQDPNGAATNTTNNTTLPTATVTTKLSGDYEILMYSWTSGATITTVATGSTIDITQANSTTVSCALGHNNTTNLAPKTVATAFSQTLSASNSRKVGQAILLNAAIPVYRPTPPDFYAWPGYESWYWVEPNVRTPRSPFAPSGPKPYPKYAARPATNPNYVFWPGYEAWYIHPTKYDLFIPPPAPTTYGYGLYGDGGYGGSEFLDRSLTPSPQQWGFWSTVGYESWYSVVQRQLGQAIVVAAAPTVIVPSAPRVPWSNWEPVLSFDWVQQRGARAPPPTAPAPYPNMAPPQHRQEYDQWPTYDWSYVQLPTKSPFASSGPASYPNTSPRSATNPNYVFWPQDYPAQSRPLVVPPPPPEQVVNVPEHDWQYWPTYDWGYVQPPTKSPFAPNGPAPYPNYASRARAVDWGHWSSEHPQAPRAGVIAPAPTPVVVPTPRSFNYPWAAEWPQQPVVRSPFAQTGPAPYPLYSPRTATDPNDYFWPGYEAWKPLQPQVKSPFAPTGPAPYPLYAPHTPATDWGYWPIDQTQHPKPRAIVPTPPPPVVPPAKAFAYPWPVEWAQQPSVRSPFAPTGPAAYPNYAAKASARDWGYWPSDVVQPTKTFVVLPPPDKYTGKPYTAIPYSPLPEYDARVPVRTPIISPPPPIFVSPPRPSPYPWSIDFPQQPAVKSPFAPNGPASYPNYAPRTPTVDWAQWPQPDIQRPRSVAAPQAPVQPVVPAAKSFIYPWPIDFPQQPAARVAFVGGYAYPGRPKDVNVYPLPPTYDARGGAATPVVPDFVPAPQSSPYPWPQDEVQQPRVRVVVIPEFVPAPKPWTYVWPLDLLQQPTIVFPDHPNGPISRPATVIISDGVVIRVSSMSAGLTTVVVSDTLITKVSVTSQAVTTVSVSDTLAVRVVVSDANMGTL